MQQGSHTQKPVRLQSLLRELRALNIFDRLASFPWIAAMDGQPSSHSNYSFYPNGEQQYAYAAAAATAAAAAQQPYSTLAGGVPTHMTHQPQLQTYSGAPVPRPHQPQIQHVSHLAISSDANKHRRSRSGCLTCRTRRVKVTPCCLMHRYG